MSDKQPTKKRRFWQLHLSTVLALTVAAGILLGLNIGTSGKIHGWPLVCYDSTAVELEGDTYYYKPMYLTGTGFRDYLIFNANGFNYWILSIDLLVNVLVLCLVAFLSEKLIRRREGRRP
jgi:hypothetical protein